MVRLYIIRHADPDYDTNRDQGGSLTDEGRKEAAALGAFLKQEGITHVHSSPMGRARLTAELALEAAGGDYADMNIVTELWAAELRTWRQVTADADNYVDNNEAPAAPVHVGEGSSSSTTTHPTTKKRKPRAVWDIPASLTRTRLSECISGISDAVPGWTRQCPDHAHHYDKYTIFCAASDSFLSEQYGIMRRGQRYGMLLTEQQQENGNKSNGIHTTGKAARIAVFCHLGTTMAWLSHLLGIPLPMVHSSFWFAPSSVTTVLFDEYNNQEDLVQGLDLMFRNDDEYVSSCGEEKATIGVCWMTPRAICVGGTNHLAMAGLVTSNSKYEAWERPSGIKCNYW